MFIYIDVVFCVNLIMNTVILIMTGWLVRLSYSWCRIILAAAVGAVYVIISALPNFVVLNSVLAKFFMSILIVLTAFGVRRLRTLVLEIAAFYTTSFLLGGAVLGWLFLWSSGDPLRYTKSYELPSLAFLAAGCLVCIGLFVIMGKVVLNGMLRQRTLYQAEVRYNGKAVTFSALLDTGNSLYSVVGRKPVVLVNQNVLETIIDDSAVNFLHKVPADKWFEELDSCCDKSWIDRVQVIPYRAVGVDSLLLGFRPDSLTVKTDSGRIETNNVVVGVFRGNLSSDNQYQALLHPAIIN